jgi:two-component system phosphate regulon sensor histidine kinase PhoR
VDGNTVSALVVLNDVTRLKALENIRRDFVANVSHELKTPITSIKGFLETLREGALKDPEHAERFLDIIIKHTDRLTAIVDDLLSLSRIERDAEKGEIALQDLRIAEVLDAVSKACRKRAQLKNIKLECEADDTIVAQINATLLEQAIVNLVDNAIKYSEPDQTVIVRAEKIGDEVVIKVVDEGCGIPRDHLERIFERFYRVDKARSRKVGGTGLGLAIVKHIVSAHGGRITVESSVGRGSTFSIYLPVAE